MSRKLVRDILVEETGVSDADLDGIEVMDDFSFVNAKERASERILRYYKKVTPKNPIVVRAKEDGKAAPPGRQPPLNRSMRPISGCRQPIPSVIMAAAPNFASPHRP